MRSTPVSIPYAISRDLPFSRVYGLSLLTALLAATGALAGLLFPGILYPTQALRGSFVSNDVVNLFIGLPVLIGALALVKRGRLTGWLLWPGALLFVTYNAIAYAVAFLAASAAGFTEASTAGFSASTGTRPLVPQIAAYLALAGLSGWTVLRLVRGLDWAAGRAALDGAVPRRLAGGVLVGLGGLFFLRAAAQLASWISGQAALAAPELGTLAADLLTTPLWVIGGVLLWRRHGLGYLSGLGLLFSASLLFVGLLVYFLLQPLLSGAPFAAVDFAVVALMGLVCFVPFGLYLRGVLKK